MAAASPKPLSMILAPSRASARAVASPIPEVEPVTSAVLPFSMGDLVAGAAAKWPGDAWDAGRKPASILVAVQYISDCGVIASLRDDAWQRCSGELLQFSRIRRYRVRMARELEPFLAKKPQPRRSSRRRVTTTTAAPTTPSPMPRRSAPRARERLTQTRRHVLEALLASHQPLGAYELIDRLAQTGAGRRRSPSTARSTSCASRVWCTASRAATPSSPACTITTAAIRWCS